MGGVQGCLLNQRWNKHVRLCRAIRDCPDLHYRSAVAAAGSVEIVTPEPLKAGGPGKSQMLFEVDHSEWLRACPRLFRQKNRQVRALRKRQIVLLRLNRNVRRTYAARHKLLAKSFRTLLIELFVGRARNVDGLENVYRDIWPGFGNRGDLSKPHEGEVGWRCGIPLKAAVAKLETQRLLFTRSQPGGQYLPERARFNDRGLLTDHDEPIVLRHGVGERVILLEPGAETPQRECQHQHEHHADHDQCPARIAIQRDMFCGHDPFRFLWRTPQASMSQS